MKEFSRTAIKIKNTKKFDPLQGLSIGYHVYFKTINFLMIVSSIMAIFSIIMLISYGLDEYTNPDNHLPVLSLA